MRTRPTVLIAVAASLATSVGLPALGQERPAGLARYEAEWVAPGVWRVMDSDVPLDQALEVKVGSDSSVWVLTWEGASALGMGLGSPNDLGADRILAVDADGTAWLRHAEVGQQGIGTWDGDTWTEITGPRRASALEPDPTGAPGVIRDMALGSDGAIWVVAGEQDSPRWERFTVERLHEGVWTTWALGEGLPELRCDKNCGDGSRVVAMDDGTIWVSVDQGGMLRFDGRVWEAVRPLGGDADLPVPSLVGEPDGVVWVDVERRPGERSRARFDGAAWRLPAHAQPEVATPAGDRPTAVGPDGTLWSVGRSEDGKPVLWAIDERQRGIVDELGSCPAGEAAGPDACPAVTSLAIGPDGLVWATLGTRDVLAGGGGPGSLVVIDPASAFDG